MKTITPEFAEILGLLCAEGSHIVAYSSYWGKDRGKDRYFKNDKSERIELYNKDEKLLLHYKNLLSKEFGFAPNVTKHGKINICRMSVIKQIIQHTKLGHLKWRVPGHVISGNSKVKISFLRGYFDGDGTSSGKVRMFSTNKEGLTQISALLVSLKLNHTFQGPIHQINRKLAYIIQISQKDKERFLNIIKPVSKVPKLVFARD